MKRQCCCFKKSLHKVGAIEPEKVQKGKFEDKGNINTLSLSAQLNKNSSKLDNSNSDIISKEPDSLPVVSSKNHPIQKTSELVEHNIDSNKNWNQNYPSKNSNLTRLDNHFQKPSKRKASWKWKVEGPFLADPSKK